MIEEGDTQGHVPVLAMLALRLKVIQGYMEVYKDSGKENGNYHLGLGTHDMSLARRGHVGACSIKLRVINHESTSLHRTSCTKKNSNCCYVKAVPSSASNRFLLEPWRMKVGNSKLLFSRVLALEPNVEVTD